MSRNWTFGQKIAAGFCVTVLSTLVVCVVAVRALQSVVESKDRVLTVNAQNLIDAARLDAAANLTSANFRGYLLSQEEHYLQTMRDSREQFASRLAALKTHAPSPERRQLLERVTQVDVEYMASVERILAARRDGAPVEVVARQFEAEVRPRREALKASLAEFEAREERLLDDGKQASTNAAAATVRLMIGISVAALMAGAIVALLLTRALTRQVGSAVLRVQSSSAELQAAASQQATGSRQQATAMSEVTTTVKELLTTSRQIGESTQRVARMMEETSTTARTGEQTVQKGREAVESIRRQVDAIVTHMLDLGKKSQQIGNILEIINEMAEQTNILAINATIESAGAGEAGKRFTVVADEIRNLADRVGRSTKDIKGLIEETRAAANTTVMATEDGSKAVEAGTRQFSEVAESFKQIKTLVETTMEAAREIELGTRQQTTAVEQVNVAITSVAQASKETEASARQTLDTSSELATLSRELSRIVQSGAGA